MKFEHLFSPMQVGKVTYRNRIVSAPMAFGLIVQNPDARDFTYRKLEASAKGGNGCVIVGETDVNFVDAVRIPGFRPFDFAKPEEDPETFDAVGEYARRIKRHGAVALAELVHCGKEKVPFGPGQEAIGPIETTNLAGVKVRPMNEDDMARIARDFAVSATYMQKAGFDGVLINITGSEDMGLEDVETAASMITQSAHPDANIIWGTAFDERLSDEMSITVVATGFESTPEVDEPIQAHVDAKRAAQAATQPAAQPAAAPVQPVQPVQPQVNPVMPNPIFTQSFSTGMDTPVAAQPAAPAEEEDDGDYFDDLLSILNKRS